MSQCQKNFKKFVENYQQNEKERLFKPFERRGDQKN